MVQKKLFKPLQISFGSVTSTLLTSLLILVHDFALESEKLRFSFNHSCFMELIFVSKCSR